MSRSFAKDLPPEDEDEDLEQEASGKTPLRGYSPRGVKASRSKHSGKSPSFLDKLKAHAQAVRAEATIEPEKIEPGKRLIALGIDFFVGFLISFIFMLIPVVNGYLNTTTVPLLFLAFRDYLFEGRGLGKNLMGLRVCDMKTGEGPSLVQTLKRNLIYLGPMLVLQLLGIILNLIPLNRFVNFDLNNILGQTFNLVASVYLLVILPIEIYRTFQREDSMRLGDELAGTCLVEAEMDFSNPMSK